MRYKLTTFSLWSIVLLSCSGEHKPQNDSLETTFTTRPVAYVFNDSLANSLIDTTYMRTGFYSLSKEGEPGIRMRKEHADEVYSLRQIPFASVDNITDAKIEKSRITMKFIQNSIYQWMKKEVVTSGKELQNLSLMQLR